MSAVKPASIIKKPASSVTALAFVLLYLSWGTTYFAIRQGVHFYRLPPALFGGVRVCLAGLVLVALLRLSGQPLRMSRRELWGNIVVGLIIFVGGNGFITFALDRVTSGTVAIMVATTPLWMALMETLLPRGERLSAVGWLGLLAGLAGVLLLLNPDLQGPKSLFQDVGPLLVLASTCSWALGSVVLRHQNHNGSHLASAAYQMTVGGFGLALIGLATGEVTQMPTAWLAPAPLVIFFYLLVVGSLVGFVAYNWLLGHVPAPIVGTYAYVNPLVAVLLGWMLGGEELSPRILGGMAIILASVALVRQGGTESSAASLELESNEEAIPIRPFDGARETLARR